MKRQIILGALFLIGGIGAQGQNVYDAANIINKDLSGTARFVGMGGAMGALGGDISTIGTNPAGIGLFRSNDINTSFSFSTLNTESKYNGSTFSTDKNRWDLNNIGAVFTTKIGDQGSLRYVNFGFNYQRSKSFYRNMNMAGIMYGDTRGYISQARQMAEQANDGSANINYGGNDIFTNPDAGWLAALGYNGWLFDQDKTSGLYHPFIPNEPYALFNSKETGGIDQYDFNVAFNLNDRLYFGITVGVYDVDYSKQTLYDEDYGNKEGYNLLSLNNISGTGFDFKFGTIIRPFEYSPLRIGLAIHTPTFYDLTLATNALLTSDVIMDNDQNTTRYTIDTYKELGGDMKRDFKLNTPWKYNLSLGYTIGNNLALGAEYEYQDYSTMKFKYADNGDMMDVETDEAKAATKGVNVLRLGAEYKVIPEFALRIGYNYTSAIFKDNAIKALPVNSIQTDTDFSNINSRNDFTIGLGYRGKSSFYADLAYKFTALKSNFYPFYNDFYKADNSYDVTVIPDGTKVKDSRSQVLLTLGFRF